jgi:dTDP-4-amino-4,6-dideoxygalactose transaminase
MVNVTKSFLPSLEEYMSILKRAWDKKWITNNGELVQELEANLSRYLGVKHVLFCSNGTIVLQMALKALGITKEVITSPFSYVATTNALLWEGCTPVFVDIETNNFCIDPNKIESAITENTQAILATHVFGFPCNVELIEQIAEKYDLKIIYDGAHAFGCEYNSKSLLSYGDVSTCSLHATKIFHTVEGGLIVCDDDTIANKLSLYRSFGHIAEEYFSIGINAKNSEFHAAMGLAIFPYLSQILERRKIIYELYRYEFRDKLQLPLFPIDYFSYNYSYFPVVFDSEESLLQAQNVLLSNGINTRRYFFPSLNTLTFVNSKSICKDSEYTAQRILCLPIYPDLELDIVKKIISLIKGCIHL